MVTTLPPPQPSATATIVDVLYKKVIFYIEKEIKCLTVLHKRCFDAHVTVFLCNLGCTSMYVWQGKK